MIFELICILKVRVPKIRNKCAPHLYVTKYEHSQTESRQESPLRSQHDSFLGKIEEMNRFEEKDLDDEDGEKYTNE
jgi:hypothetical protein